MNINDYSFGIYYYLDNETGDVVYIGLDSHINENKRHKQHLYPSNYDVQPFNKVLQNNPDRYEYNIYCHVPTIKEANQLEFDLINLYRPKFNYKHGGGCYINIDRNFEYTIIRKGRMGFCIRGKNNKAIKYCVDRSKLVPLCDALNNGDLTEEEVKSIKISLDFDYTISKDGINGFVICGQDHTALKRCRIKSKLIPIVKALNNGTLSETDVKSVRGVNKILDNLNEH